MSPGRMERLKPYFKPRPRYPQGAAPQQAAPGQPVAPVQQPAAPIQQPAAPAPAAAPQSAPAQPGPGAGDGTGLAARREQLATRYADLQSDLGGLVYEMAIRDSFRLDVVTRRAAELQAVDAELSAVESQLGLAPPGTPACPSCGAAVQVGAQYCARCGTAVGRPPTAAGGTA